MCWDVGAKVKRGGVGLVGILLLRKRRRGAVRAHAGFSGCYVGFVVPSDTQEPVTHSSIKMEGNKTYNGDFLADSAFHALDVPW